MKALPTITEAATNFDPSIRYDVDIAVPISTESKYAHRLECFKLAGLYNFSGRKVHLSLLGGPSDRPNIGRITEGWPTGIHVSLLLVSDGRPLPKANAYYLWQRVVALKARWRLRVDDDSMTDLGSLLDDAERRYGNTPVHIMTNPFVNAGGIEALVSCMKEQGVALPVTMHEYECSLSSEGAMRRVFDCPAAVKFLAASSSYIHQQSDQTLALAMIAAGVVMAVNPRLTSEFRKDELTLVGGNLHHIHYVEWDAPSFSSMAIAFHHGKRTSLEGLAIESILERPLPFGRCIDSVISELILLPDGRVEGFRSENESRWRFEDNHFLLSRPDGVTMTLFQELLSHGPRRWIIGPYLHGHYIHFLRLA